LNTKAETKTQELFWGKSKAKFLEVLPNSSSKRTANPRKKRA